MKYDCHNCIHAKECPVQWNRGNAACITIYKSLDEALDEYRNLRLWVKGNYIKKDAEKTAECSRGNFDDCFDDGYDCGFSWAVYEVGGLLGMFLEKPIEVDKDIY